MKKTDLAYTAGIIDGEGCISIEPWRQKGKCISYRLQVVVVSTDEWLPMWLKFAYGGSVYKRTLRNTNWNSCWCWTITTRQAGEFLKLILPYLHLKRQQAEIGIGFQSRKSQGHYGNGRPMPESIKILQEADAIMLKKMHKGKVGGQ